MRTRPSLAVVSALVAGLLAASLVLMAVRQPVPAVEGGSFVNGHDSHQATNLAQVVREDDFGAVYACTGAVINTNKVLTAAHCFDVGTEWFVRTGSVYRGQGEMHRIARIDKHNDLAMITTEKVIDLHGARPFRAMRDARMRMKETYWAYGFGRTCINCPASEQAKFAWVKVNELEARDSKGGPAFRTRGLSSARLHQGDSGGPVAVAERGAEDFIVGVNSTVNRGTGVVDHRHSYVNHPDNYGWLRQHGLQEGEPEIYHDILKRELRIMPTGDSITHGVTASTTSAYRRALWDDLDGQPVDFVGGQRSGDLPDADHEGVPGDRIDQIAARAAVSVPRDRPNVVLLHAGTNDLNGNHDVDGAPVRLDRLIDQLRRDRPDITVIVATLVPAANPEVQARIEVYNEAVRDLVGRRRATGQHVALAEMGHLTAADLEDGLHPDAAGYVKMADAFGDALLHAIVDGWIADPGSGGGGSGGPTPGTRVDIGANARVCTSFGQWMPRGVVASGTGEVDLSDQNGRYADFADIDGDGRDEYLTVARRGGAVNVWWNAGPLAGREGWGWQPKGQLASGVGDRVVFADLTGDRREEYLVVDGNGAVWMWWNRGPHAQGGWWWEPIGMIASGTGPNVAFGDLDGDGRDDYTQIDPASGAVRVWWNRGPQASQPTRDAGWHWVGDGQLVGEGVPLWGGSRVELADANGDALDDYVVIDADSSVRLWVRTGPGPHQWHDAGVLAPGVAPHPGYLIRLVDLDADRKIDYLALDQNGAARGWINDCRSHGTPGAVCSRFHGGMWTGRGEVAAGVDGVSPIQGSDVVRFADLDGDGRDEYLAVGSRAGGVRTWWNSGPLSGSQGWGWEPKGVLASGVGASAERVRFADMDGDGRDDYLVIDAVTGSVQMWHNEGPDGNGGWRWGPVGTIASGTGSNVAFGDLDGDGRDDYLQVDITTGAVEVWWNGGAREGGWHWEHKGVLASGVGARGHQIRFEDIDGDGDDDYLVVHDDSSVSAWLSGGHTADGVGWNWYPVGKVAHGVGVPTGYVRLVHLNDDRRIDYLAVDATGRADGWLNTCS